MGIAVIVLLCIIIAYFVFKIINFKKLKVSSINMFTGQLKTGKSALSLRYALYYYKQALINYHISNFFNTIFNFLNRTSYFIEKPLLYSNIPLGVPYVPLTLDVLYREKRIAYKSIVFIDEISLLADNYDYKDEYLNERLKMFFKLFGHMSKGGKLFINTQNISDNHYIVKRSLNQYLYIHHKIRLPFYSILKVRELYYNDDNNSINAFNSDVEDDLKTIIISNKVFKYYDCYCYSILTDNLGFYSSTYKRLYKKIKNILSFKRSK